MIEKLRKLRENMREKTGFAAMVEVYGKEELILTGCLALLDFSDSIVYCRTVSGDVKVWGSSLCVQAYRQDLLLVSGNITGITFGEEEECL